MANRFLSTQSIARKMLPLLQENLVFPALCANFTNELAPKDEVLKIERPAVYIADEFENTINLQDTKQKVAYIRVPKIADVSAEINAADLAMQIGDFERKHLQSAAVAIAEKINADGLEMYKYVNSYSGIAGTTPSTLADFANARKMLNINKVPVSGRKAVWDPEADAKFSTLDAIVSANKSGSTNALREGNIGRVAGFDNYMSQSVKTHIAGGYVTGTTTGEVNIVNNAQDSITGFDYSVVTMQQGTVTTSLKLGDIFTLDNKQFVVLEDTANAIAGALSVKAYPQVATNIASGPVTFADATSGGHVANLAFVKDAFGFVTRPLGQIQGGVEMSEVTFNGLSLRVAKFYDGNTKKLKLSMDVLYGYAPLYPELATLILG